MGACLEQIRSTCYVFMYEAKLSFLITIGVCAKATSSGGNFPTQNRCRNGADNLALAIAEMAFCLSVVWRLLIDTT